MYRHIGIMSMLPSALIGSRKNKSVSDLLDLVLDSR